MWQFLINMVALKKNYNSKLLFADNRISEDWFGNIYVCLHLK